MEFIKCAVYLILLSLLFFVIGRLMSKMLLPVDCKLFQSLPFENEGKVYNRLNVKEWKGRVPDMSRILPHVMPPKRVSINDSSSTLELLLKETCIAEITHELLCFFGFACTLIWRGLGGFCVSVIYMLGNLPYIIIQRYNRPKLRKLISQVREKEDAALSLVSSEGI